MGVELADVVGVGEGVAGTQGEHGQGGALEDVLGEGVSRGGRERAPPAGKKQHGLARLVGVFDDHVVVLLVVGVVLDRGKFGVRVQGAGLDRFPGQGTSGG